MTHSPERVGYKLRNEQDNKMVVETAKQKTNELTDGRAKRPNLCAQRRAWMERE